MQVDESEAGNLALGEGCGPGVTLCSFVCVFCGFLYFLCLFIYVTLPSLIQFTLSKRSS